VAGNREQEGRELRSSRSRFHEECPPFSPHLPSKMHSAHQTFKQSWLHRVSTPMQWLTPELEPSPSPTMHTAKPKLAELATRVRYALLLYNSCTVQVSPSAPQTTTRPLCNSPLGLHQWWSSRGRSGYVPGAVKEMRCEMCVFEMGPFGHWSAGEEAA
jgi:hypothetical protein